MNAVAQQRLRGGRTSRAEAKPISSSRKSVAKRDAIIGTAIRIINEKSYEMATMREIAAALDLRDAALYYYFSSKQSLAYAAHVQSLERFERTLLSAAQSNGSGLERLRTFLLDFLVDSYDNGPQLYFGEHSYLEQNQREEIDGWAGRLITIIEGIIIEGLTDGSLQTCEPKLVVQLLLGMLIWLAKWVPSIEGLTPERLMRAIDDVAFRGIGAVGYPRGQ